MSDLPHPSRCEWCARCVAETGGVVSLCLDHQHQHQSARRSVTAEDRDRWNEEAAFEAELEADQRWADDQAMADWQQDQEW